jgi:hypothetical protein
MSYIEIKRFYKICQKNDIIKDYNYWKVITPTGCHKAYSGFLDIYILNT